MAIDYKALAKKAAETTDHTETSSHGDFERHQIPAGKTLARFIEYIELGVQSQGQYAGKPKPDCATVRLTWELLGNKNIREIEDGEGNKRTIADRYSKNIGIKLGDLATFKKYFKAMTYGRDDISHMAQMLNEVFVLEFSHKEGKDKAGKDVVWVNLGKEGALGIESPYQNNPVTGETIDVSGQCRPAISPIKIFLWEDPTKETWDSLYIEGTRTVKDAKGNETQESKNWLQEKILGAKDFSGSPLEDLLTNSQELAEELEAAEAKPVVKKSDAATGAAKVTKKATTTATQEKQDTVAKTATTPTKSPSKPVVKAKAKKEESAEAVDPLAALGLN